MIFYFYLCSEVSTRPILLNICVITLSDHVLIADEVAREKSYGRRRRQQYTSRLLHARYMRGVYSSNGNIFDFFELVGAVFRMINLYKVRSR